jgi:magnesium chelatase subunit I
MKPATLGELKKAQKAPTAFRSVKDEIRENLLEKLRCRQTLFPGIIGYEESVVPSVVNALLSKHNLILLGLRGQAKSRILRALTSFLDEEIPVIQGCEINDDPFFPICSVCRNRIEEEGDAVPIAYLNREERYIEKLATPDVTIADIIGDLDPIKAASKGRELSAHENIHFGLLPRAHRGIFAINELPDLAPKIQVGLFNIMQEGDVQIKGFPIRLPLDLMMVFSANPEDYTARGKIITPLKDRIGSEVRTHYPLDLQHGMQITGQESWVERRELKPIVPDFIKETVEGIAFLGRQDNRIDKRSGVSQRLPISCLENAVSNAERRALTNGEKNVVVRISDVYAAVPAITGKLELEYEGELKGSDHIARELIQAAVLTAFEKRFPNHNFEHIVQWFNLGGQVKVADQTPTWDYLQILEPIQGITEILQALRISKKSDPELAVAAIEFVFEGLYAEKKLSRNEERGYYREMEKPEDDYFKDMQSRKRSFN